MQLDKIKAAIRPRSAWEATDLGMLMAVRWWWPMTKAWLVITIPVFLLLQLVPGEAWVPAMLFWWLKPLWERIHLYIVSKALFGHVPGVLETCRAFPGLILPRLFQSLVWRRLTTHRSMNAPVMQLEGLRGSRYHQRLKLMHASDDEPSQWLLFAGASIETMLFLSIGLLVTLLIPDELDSTVGEALFADTALWTSLLQNFGYYLCATVVAPFYVAGGFALYLNRRVKLEAWDIEIAFRKMAAARKAASSSVLARVAVLLLALTLPLADPSAHARAAEADAENATEPGYEEMHDSVSEVMERSEFHEIVSRPVPQLDEDVRQAIMDFLEKIFRFFSDRDVPDPSVLFATVIEVLLWIGVFGLLVVVLIHYRYWLNLFGVGKRLAVPAFSQTHHTAVAGRLDLGNQELPEDVAAACKALWRQGAALDAIALLYRASLVVFMRSHRLSFPVSTTEGEHLAKVRSTLTPETTAYFAKVNRIWLFLAYGKRAPEEAVLFALCESWQRDWDRPVREQAGGSNGAGA